MKTVVRRTSSAVVAGCIALLVTACGGDDPKTEEGAEDVVEEYVEAFVDGDGDACDLLTDDYAEELVDDWNEGGFGGDEEAEDCDDVIEAGAVFAEAFDADDLEVADFTTEVDGDEATVEVDYEDSDFSSETYQLVYDGGEWLIDGEGEGDADEESGDVFEEDEDAETVTTTVPPEPSAIGDVVTVGDWSVTVVEVERNADKTIKKANPYNDPADFDYLLVTYEATYQGSDRTADVTSDLSWSLTTAAQQVLDDDGQVTPADDASWPTEARPGGTLRGQAVFDVDPAELDGALLSVETYSEDGEELYVDFTL
jgi:hypothetical protein